MQVQFDEIHQDTPAYDALLQPRRATLRHFASRIIST
jgi:hypothetical protein